MRIITRWKSSYTAKKLYPFYLKCYLDNATAADKLKKKGLKKERYLIIQLSYCLRTLVELAFMKRKHQTIYG